MVKYIFCVEIRIKPSSLSKVWKMGPVKNQNGQAKIDLP